MRHIVERYPGLAEIIETNADRCLAPLLIVAALFLGGWLVSLLPFL